MYVLIDGFSLDPFAIVEEKDSTLDRDIAIATATGEHFVYDDVRLKGDKINLPREGETKRVKFDYWDDGEMGNSSIFITNLEVY